MTGRRLKAFIFNSGVGSRLGELTKDVPKALVPLKSGETILGRQLRLLKTVGIKDVIISTGYKEELIKEFCLKEFPELDFTFVYNPRYSETNSIYSMWLAEKEMRFHDFIIMHGDLVFDEGILRKLVDNKYWDLACINKHIPQPDKDFKGRLDKDGHLRQIDVHLHGENDFALQPLYKICYETIYHWFDEMKPFIKNDYKVNVYAEAALNKFLPYTNVKFIDYNDNYLEEIDNLDDYNRVSEEIRNYDFDKQITYTGEYVVMIDKVFKKYKYKKPFVVYSRAAHKNPEYTKYAKEYEVVSFNGYSPNPKYEEVLAGLKLFKENNCDAIIAIGGGSCMDVAKAIKLFSVLDPNIHYLKQKPKFATVPLIAVPTTAGTGSEATRYSVIYHNGEKQSLTHDSIFPNVAIIDPSFLNDLPEYHRKSSFLDAFCQAMEGYWAVRSTPASRRYSERAIILFLTSRRSYLYEYPYINDSVMKCAYLAGQSINITTTTAPHAMSYKLTTLKGIAHGHAVSITLPYVLEYILEHIDQNPELKEHLENLTKLFEVELNELPNQIKYIFSTFELETHKVSEKELDELVESVNVERLSNNPMPLSKEAIRHIYMKSLGMI